MRKLLPMMLLLIAAPVFGQIPDPAVGTYAENNKLVSITNLTGLSDCKTGNVMGILKKVKIRGKVAPPRLKVDEESRNIDMPLDRLTGGDRLIIFNHLVRTGLILRIAGYACAPEAPMTAFSIDRIY